MRLKLKWLKFNLKTLYFLNVSLLPCFSVIKAIYREWPFKYRGNSMIKRLVIILVVGLSCLAMEISGFRLFTSQTAKQARDGLDAIRNRQRGLPQDSARGNTGALEVSNIRNSLMQKAKAKTDKAMTDKADEEMGNKIRVLFSD